ncbi:MAG: leucine-rich repeat domain-containing protein [Eubacterium sp.]
MYLKRTGRKVSALALALILAAAIIVPLGVTQKAYAEDGVAVDETNFPDKKFRSYVSKHFDTDRDGYLSTSEISKATGIALIGWDEKAKASSLKGIEYLTSLRLLNCEKIPLESLDVSRNTALESLTVRETPLLSLDVSNNPALRELNCISSPIASLNLSSNTALERLSCINIPLSSLDLSNNTALDYISCGGTDITRLDVSSCPDIETMYCSNNRLTSVNARGCTSLRDLQCSKNQITSLNVSGCTSLNSLDCSENQLTGIDVSQCTRLRSLACSKNQLTSLDISNNTGLQSIDCAGNQITDLDVSIHTDLGFLNCSDNMITSLDVNSLDIRTLICSNNQIASLDVSNRYDLSYFLCNNNQLTSLDLSTNYNLPYPCECFSVESQSATVHAVCSSGKLVVDLAGGLGLDLDRVSDVVVTGGTYADGKAAFDIPLAGDAEITYHYDTHKPDFFNSTAQTKMDVALNVVWDGHTLTHHDGVEPTCTEKGREEYWTCSICGCYFADEAGTEEVTDLSTLDIPALGHDFSTDWTADGIDHWQTCSRCGVKSEILEHSFDAWVHTGSHTHVCPVCGFSETEECTFGDWKVTKQPTATEKGEREHTCVKCGYVETAEIAAIGTAESENPDVPRTGDRNNMLLWAILMTAASCAGLMTIRMRKEH